MTTLHDNEGQAHELGEQDILLNDVTMPGDYNPNNVRPWVIGHEYGPICAVWAANEQEALDEMLDRGYEQFLVADEDFDEDLDEQDHYAHLGNAGLACDLSYAWIKPIVLDEKRDFRVLLDMYLASYLGQRALGHES